MIDSIKSCDIPDGGLLNRYTIDGAYTDCFVTEVAGAVSHKEFIQAFYTTRLFKLERAILKWAVSKPSTDQQVKRLAAGTLENFAAWHVEDRCENQLLLCDFQRRTRSWLMVETFELTGKYFTRLYFGSAVVPSNNSTTEHIFSGLSFRLLLGFHTLYSKLLLLSAKSNLIKSHKLQ